jgi:hypothetical protein
MNSATPVLCNMSVFTATERESHIRTTTQLFQAVEAVREIENGYEFAFPNETGISKIAEFISKERLCCPFLKFTLMVSSDRELLSLSLTGPVGTREFLRLEFSGAFQ